MKKALVIGYGSIAKKHISILKDVLSGIEITVMRSSKEKAKESLDGISFVVDPDHLNNSLIYDFALICNPAPFHLDIAKKLIKNKIPTFCEKPLSINMEGLKELQTDVEITKVPFLVGYVLRYLPSLNKVKEIVESNKYGKILAVTSEIGQYLPLWRKKTDYRNDVSAKKSLGGGATLELSHEIDYINWIFGMPSELVAFEKKFSSLEVDVEDSSDSIFCYDGFNLHLHLDMFQTQTTRKLKIVFEGANLSWCGLSHKIEISSDLNNIKIEKQFDSCEMYLVQMKNFLDCCEGESSDTDSLKASIDVMKIITAIKESSLKKEVVKL